jgi:hypothetical protein
MRSRIKVILGFAALSLLCGCFHIEVFHKLDRYGNSDSGGWRMWMDDLMYAAFAASDDFDAFLAQAREFSNPTIRSSGGNTYIEDVSGRASMEHIYDNYSCDPDPNSSRYVICEFSASDTGLDFPDWNVDWTIELEPGMQMLSSNHHRTRTENGRVQYLWYFDGDRVSAYNIHYRVRTPRA